MLSAFLLHLLLTSSSALESDIGGEWLKESPPNELIEILTVNLESAFFTVSDRYLCVTIDSNAMRSHWAAIDLTTPIIVTLASGLSPLTLRVGGTSQDFAYFVPDSLKGKQDGAFPKEKAAIERKPKYYCKNGFRCINNVMDDNFTVSTQDWDVLNEFVKKVGWELLYGLNDYIMKDWESGVWDSSNAEELVKYTMEKGYTLLAWELGNEPDGNGDPYDALIVPGSLSNDFYKLYEMLQQVGWPDIRLAGPDTATLHSGNAFYSNFLNDTKAGVLHAVTYHQYYMAAQTAKEDDFISISKLDGFIGNSLFAAQMVQELQPSAELWLGETATAYDGGTDGLSDAYIAGFMWLDKLGLAALLNHTKVFRQTFYGGFYALTNPDGTPRPDYWLSLLYLRLVGPTVLEVSGGIKYGRNVRIYAHCVRPSDTYKIGDVVLYMLNLHHYKSYIYLNNEELSESNIDVYWLEPGDANGLLSKDIALNGKVLTMVNNLTLPELTPQTEPPRHVISLPSMSYGFMVFKDANATACMTN